ADCRRRQVLVREHAALRRPRRAGRVDQGGDVVLADRLCLTAFAPDLGELVEADDLAERRQLAAHRLELLALDVVLDEGEDGFGVAEDVRALARGVRRVEPDDDGADRHDRPVEEDPLEARPRDDGDGVALADAAGEEPLREVVDPLSGLAPGDLPPAVRAFLEVRRRRPALRHRPLPEGARGPRLQGRFARGRGRGGRRHLTHRREKESGVQTRIRSAPMRTIWNGSISFGLVNIPIGLALATQRSDIAFRTLHRECGTPIKQKRWCPFHEREVEQDELVKGWEVAKGEYVLVEESDLESVALQRSQSIEILRFVRLEDVDPVYFDRTYYLAPAAAEAARRPYVLLLRAMQASGMAAVGKFVLWGKENLCLIRSQDDALVLELLFFAEDVRAKNEIEEAVETVEVKKAELQLA